MPVRALVLAATDATDCQDGSVWVPPSSGASWRPHSGCPDTHCPLLAISSILLPHVPLLKTQVCAEPTGGGRCKRAPPGLRVFGSETQTSMAGTGLPDGREQAKQTCILYKPACLWPSGAAAKAEWDDCLYWVLAASKPAWHDQHWVVTTGCQPWDSGLCVPGVSSEQAAGRPWQLLLQS